MPAKKKAVVKNTSLAKVLESALGNLEKANARVLGFIWNRVALGSIAHYARYEKYCRSRAGIRAAGRLAPNPNN